MPLLRRSIAAALSGSLLLSTAAPVLAQTPSDLRDLVGARAGQAEGEFQARGYTFVRTQGGGNSKRSYWRRGDHCVQVTTADGRYQSIDRMSRDDCDRGGSSSGSDAAAVAAGVAIVGLAAAIAAHNKRDHDKGADHDNEYQRGYQAGLYGGDYDRHDSEAYHDGFIAGETEGSNRRYASSRHVDDAPYAAKQACAREADEYQSRPYGSSVAISVRALGRGDYEMTMATGSYRSICVASSSGVVRSINPY
ncbi:MAG: hypothetical protein V4466_01170 [Pseudomonadota bacterium]